jgi:hypothetical protein
LRHHGTIFSSISVSLGGSGGCGWGVVSRQSPKIESQALTAQSIVLHFNREFAPAPASLKRLHSASSRCALPAWSARRGLPRGANRL